MMDLCREANAGKVYCDSAQRTNDTKEKLPTFQIRLHSMTTVLYEMTAIETAMR